MIDKWGLMMIDMICMIAHFLPCQLPVCFIAYCPFANLPFCISSPPYG